MFDKKHLYTIAVAVAFTFVGISIGHMLGNTFAQNQTQYAPVTESINSLLGSVTGIVIAIASLIGMLVKAGLLDKRIGSVAVIASDSSVAVRDNRQTIKDLVQNTYDVAKLTSPEAAKAADEKLAPVLSQASQKLDEYTPKVEKFTKLGNILSKGGEKTTPEIKEDEALKSNIPDEIVPT